MLQCGRCRAAWFCGVDCQRAAWPVRAVWGLKLDCISPMQSKGHLGCLLVFPLSPSKPTRCCCCRSTSKYACRAQKGSKSEGWVGTKFEPCSGRTHLGRAWYAGTTVCERGQTGSLLQHLGAIAVYMN